MRDAAVPGPLHVDLPDSPLANDAPARLHVRDAGAGPAVLFLHGGWGYGYYPFEPQRAALEGFRTVAPDRSGYGESTPPLDALPLDFHARAAEESVMTLDAIGVDRALLWGHSDGAVVALLMGLRWPERFPAMVVEATHLWREKAASRAFFEAMADDPARFGARVAERLAATLGTDWRRIVRANGRAWLALAASASSPTDDLFGGRLPTLASRVLVLHGARDPRTEPGELDALLAAIPRAEPAVLAEGQHSPHSEKATADAATRASVAFLRDAARDL